MAVLAPPNPQHPFHASDDWYRPYKRAGGLATPTSTISQISAASFSRYHSVDRDSQSDRSTHSNGESLNMAPTQSPLLADSVITSATNSAKPSLPSIRSLLAEPLGSSASPPFVPRTSQHYSPKIIPLNEESAHKRSRSNYAWDRRPSLSSPNSVHSFAPLPSEYASRRDSATQATLEPLAYGVPKDGRSQHRLPSTYLPALRTTMDQAYRAPSPVRSAPAESHSNSRKRSYASYSAPAQQDRPPFIPIMGPVTPRTQHTSHIGVRTPVIQAPPAYAYHASSSRHSDGLHNTSYSASAYRPMPASGLPMPAGAARSVYDYSLAKSRKRSNLPKESTDIMKRWFEDHLDNPYPSEEEKKYFAARAGINTTQVSNWFINHRRRCPELKEQRDKRPHSNRPVM